MIRPGEIYVADFAEAGPHPVIVLSREELTRGRYALVVVCTSARFAVRSQLPNCVPFRAGEFGWKDIKADFVSLGVLNVSPNSTRELSGKAIGILQLME